MELCESLRVLELFHTSAVLLYEQLSDGKCKTALKHPEIIPAGASSTFNLQGIAKKYKLAIRKTPIDVPAEWDSTLPVGDFWEFLHLRAKKTGNRSMGYDMTGLRNILTCWTGLANLRRHKPYTARSNWLSIAWIDARSAPL